MILVVDASVAAKWFVKEPDSDAAAALLGDPDARFIAPDLIQAEVVGVLWRKALQGAMTAALAQEAAAQLEGFFDEMVPIAILASRALTIAIELRHAVYDCFYLALAEARSAPVVTADRKLHGAVQGTTWANLARLLP